MIEGDRRMGRPSVRRRVAAYMFDGFVIAVVAILGMSGISLVLGASPEVQVSSAGEARLVYDPVRQVLQAAGLTALSALYFTLSWRVWGASIGQRALGLRVVDAVTGRTVSGRAAIKRWMALGLPIGLVAAVVVESAVLWTIVVAISALWSLVLLVSVRRDAVGRGVHDRIAGTTVVPGGRSGGRRPPRVE